jgi:hypothetical protein
MWNMQGRTSNNTQKPNKRRSDESSTQLEMKSTMRQGDPAPENGTKFFDSMLGPMGNLAGSSPPEEKGDPGAPTAMGVDGAYGLLEWGRVRIRGNVAKSNNTDGGGPSKPMHDNAYSSCTNG